MKRQKIIDYITTLFKSTFENMHIFGLFGIIAAQTFFLLEIVEFVGFNALRIIFSIVALTNFSLLLFTVFQNYWLRIFGVGFFLLLLWVNVLNFRYFGSTMHIGALLNIGFLPVLGTQILLLTRWYDAVYLLSFFATIIFYRDTSKISIQKRIPSMLFFTAVWTSLQVFQYFAETQSPIRSARKYDEPFTRWDIYKDIRFESRDHTGSVLQFGFLWTYGVDLYRAKSKPELTSVIAESNFLIHLPVEQQRNIVAIQVESLDKHIINHTVEGVPVMDFLGRSAEQSIYFSNLYAQHTSVGGTSDAEFCMLTSQYPLGQKGAFFANGLEKLPSIPVILNNNGYRTLAFHGNSGSYFNRKQGLLQLGFQKTFFKNDFIVTNPDKWHALKDKDFLQQTQKILADVGSPYFAYILTLTSHTPFDLITAADYTSQLDVKNQLVQNYLHSMAYVDRALEEFISSMQQLDPNALIIIFGDHCSNIREKEYASYNIKGLEPIPFFILDQLNPVHKEISAVGTTIDIGPSLFDYLDVETPAFWQGKSLLNQQSRENTFIYNSEYYFDTSGTLQTLSDQPVDTEELFRIQNYIW